MKQAERWQSIDYPNVQQKSHKKRKIKKKAGKHIYAQGIHMNYSIAAS